MRQSKKNAVRLNKLISDAGFCSRREADEYIAQERVTVNSHTAQMGDKAFKTDFIRIDGEPLRFVVKEEQPTRKPEFASKRISRNVEKDSKKSKDSAASKGDAKSFKKTKDAPSKEVDSKLKPSAKGGKSSKPAAGSPEKKVGAAKKWFSGRKK